MEVEVYRVSLTYKAATLDQPVLVNGQGEAYDQAYLRLNGGIWRVIAAAQNGSTLVIAGDRTEVLTPVQGQRLVHKFGDGNQNVSLAALAFAVQRALEQDYTLTEIHDAAANDGWKK